MKRPSKDPFQRYFTDRVRHLPKSDRTRGRILDATVSVIARFGFDAATASEIAKEAEIANGTFYLHFKDKDDALQQAALSIATEIAAQLDEALSGIEDAVARTSWATRQTLEIAAANSDWGWALARALLSLPEMSKQAAAYLRKDLERGVRQGVFNAVVDDVLVAVYVSMTAAAIRTRLSDLAGAEVGSRVAELQLRMLGVPARRAHAAAWSDMEKPARAK